MIAAGLKDTAVVRSRDKMTFHSPLGSREQSVDELTNNAMAIWTRVTGKLERGVGNIRSCYVKTSMGPSVKIKVIE
jgi:large subunit ribosomal protein L1